MSELKLTSVAEPQTQFGAVGFSPNSLQRRKGDMVGRRVLCVLKDKFSIAGPSPVQLSSSLWSAEVMNALRQNHVEARWCPLHHHHQPSQENLIKKIVENVTYQELDQRLSANAQVNSIKKKKTCHESHKDSPNSSSQLSLAKSVNQLKQPASSSSTGVGHFGVSDGGRDGVDTNSLADCCTESSCELCDAHTERDLFSKLRALPWRLGTIRAASHRDLVDKNLNIMIEFDLHPWQSRDWYQVYNEQPEGEHSPVESEDSDQILPKFPKSVAVSQGATKCDRSNEVDLGSKASNDGDDLSSCAFSTLLIEASMSCLARAQSPTGRDRLWPALTFEPLIDELGLFVNSVSPKLLAIEYLDPPRTQIDCNIMQHVCDIKQIALEMGFNSSYESKGSHLTPVMSSPQSGLDTSSSCKEKFVLQEASCHCWSPKVEFVEESKVYQNKEASMATKMMLNFKLDSEPTCSTQKSSCSPAEVKSEIPSSSLDGTSSMIASTSEDINSLKRFLRFYSNVFSHINKTKDGAVTSQASYSLPQADSNNDLLEAFMKYPNLYHKIRRWHLYQDAQSLFGNVCTAALLVGNRIKVYRSSGTTQWYTAVIISHDERTNLLTLIDDTVLEEHHEDPTLLEMHLIDDGLVQSIIEGDDSGNVGNTRRRTQRSNQRLAAQTAQIAIMNSSTSTLATVSTAPLTLTAGQLSQANSGFSQVISKQQQNKSLSLTNSSLPLSLSSFLFSSSSSSSSSSLLLSTSSILQPDESKPLNSFNIGASKQKKVSVLDHETTQANANASSRVRRSASSSSSVIFNGPSTSHDKDCNSIWSSSRFNGTNNGKRGQNKQQHEDKLESDRNDVSTRLTDKSNFLSPFARAPATDLSSVKLGLPKSATKDGKNFLLHMKRLEESSNEKIQNNSGISHRKSPALSEQNLANNKNRPPARFEEDHKSKLTLTNQGDSEAYKCSDQTIAIGDSSPNKTSEAKTTPSANTTTLSATITSTTAPAPAPTAEPATPSTTVTTATTTTNLSANHHSVLAAAAALQSLNQAHLQQQQQQQQQRHHQNISQTQSNRPPQPPPSNHSMSIPIGSHANNMPKLGNITSTTTADHQNHNHLAQLTSCAQHHTTQMAGQQERSSPDLFAVAAQIQQHQLQLKQQQQQQQQQQQMPTFRPPISWQDTQHQPNGSPQKWLYSNPYSSSFGPPAINRPPLSTITTSSGGLCQPVSSSINSVGQTTNNNMCNSNNMIGQDGENQANNNGQIRLNKINNDISRQIAANIQSLNNNNNNNNNNPSTINTSTTASNNSTKMIPSTTTQNLIDAKSALNFLNASPRVNYNWLDNNGLKSNNNNNQPMIDAKTQSQRISDEIERNLERLSMFTFNQMSNCIPGTTKLKKVVLINSIMGLRQSIQNGELYTKFEDIAVNILTNQVIIPDFSIIDYIRREKSSGQEIERMDNVHKRLGLSSFLCLIELAHQRSYQPMMPKDLNDIRQQLPTSLASDPLNNLNSNNNMNMSSSIYNQPSFNHQLLPQLKQSPFLAPLAGKANDKMANIEKNIPASQSLSDSFYRSQQPSNNGPTAQRMSTAPPQQHPLVHHQNPHHILPTSHLPPPVLAQQRSYLPPPHARSSPYSPMSGIQSNTYNGYKPPRPNSTIGLGLTPESQGLDLMTREPPAAHQSSARPTTLDPHLSSPFSSPPNRGPLVSAHLSSITPQTHRLQTQDTSPPSKPLNPSQSPSRLCDDRQSARNIACLGSNQPYPSGKQDIDPITGLPVMTLLSLKQQQEIASREMALKRSSTPHYPAHGYMGLSNQNIEVSRSPSGSDIHFNPRQPMDTPVQSMYNPHLSSHSNIYRPSNYNNAPSSTSMPPPTMEYNKNLNQNDINRLNDPRSTMISPGMNMLANNNELQMKQYTSLMNAYQQQQLLMSSKPGSIIGPPMSTTQSLTMNMNQPQQMGYNQLAPKDTLLLEVQDQNLLSDPKVNTQQVSPKAQRSIVTGAGSSIPPKRAKKVKASPTGQQTAGDNKSPTLVSPTSTNNRSISDSENVAQQHLLTNSIELDSTASKPTNGPSSIGDIPFNHQQTNSSPVEQETRSEGGIGVTFASHLDAKNATSSSEHIANAQSTSNVNSTRTCSPERVSDKTQNSGTLCGAKTGPSGDSNVTELQNDPDRDVFNNTVKFQSSRDNSIAPSLPLETSKYQKLYTKKAWLKNYDQEDQARTTSEDNMAVEKTSPQNEEVDPSNETVKQSAKQNDTRTKQNLKSESKKKQKDTSGSTKTISNKLNRASKVSEQDSEASNDTTSYLDSDESASNKSQGDKRLRRMPPRRVKPSQEKEEEKNSPRSRVNKEPVHKRNKKDRNTDDTAGGKRKNAASAEEDVAPTKKVKKLKTAINLQTDPCYDIVPKNIRCLECRRVRQSSLKADKTNATKQSAKANWDDFCRFYEFRKLRHNKASQIIVAGFSDIDDATEKDKAIWLPDLTVVPGNMSYKVAKFIISNIGREFCNLVMQERAAKSKAQEKDDRKIMWKRAVNGLRELCDVCATTLFNCHYFCERCGFVVCLDCYQAKAKMESKVDQDDNKPCTIIKKDFDGSMDKHDVSENGHSESSEAPIPNASKKSKRDSCGWIYCAKNEEHVCEKLILTQIIAGDCLEELWSMLHQVEKRLNLGPCQCNENIKETSIEDNKKDDQDDKQVQNDNNASERTHSTLKGLLLATSTNNNGLDEASDSQSFASDILNIKQEKISNYSALDDVKMFNDDDSQEDTKLSQQVTAAIEGCISSLPNGGADSPNFKSGSFPDQENEIGKMDVEQVSTTQEDKPTIHSWLCDGDLLVLHQANHKSNVELFRQQWLRGKPVLVRGVDKLMKIDMWLPQFFGKEFGDYRSDLVDCRNGDIHRHSMKKYWEGFEPTTNGSSTRKKIKEEAVPVQIPSANNEELSLGPSYYSGSALWRLKDWPPGQDFYEILPSHYEDFMNNLPLRQYTTRNGKLNLACRLPKEMLKPDLGPKMYSAYGTTKFPERGTTNLHLDISDAINVMVYVSGATSFNSGSGESRDTFDKTIEDCVVDNQMKQQIRANKFIPGALWHVFHPSDAQKMRDFLNKVSDERNISAEKRHDPIHDQTWYLDQTLLDRLEQEYKVKAYSILQCMGDAILIPAGAPHQVKNLQNCIKVANDFVSPENVKACLQLTDEFRALPETHMNQEDKLQIKNILYHSIKESLHYIQMFESNKIDLTTCSGNEDDEIDYS